MTSLWGLGDVQCVPLQLDTLLTSVWGFGGVQYCVPVEHPLDQAGWDQLTPSFFFSSFFKTPSLSTKTIQLSTRHAQKRQFG